MMTNAQTDTWMAPEQNASRTILMNTFIRTKHHKKNSTKNTNIQPSLHIHQISGTPNQQLNTAA